MSTIVSKKNTSNRNELITNAKNLLQKAKDGSAKRRRSKSTRAMGLTNLIINAPTLFIEEEVTLYIDAAEAFLICSKWTDAAEAFAQAAWIVGNDLNQKEEAAILCTNAGMSAMKFEIGQAVQYFIQAVSYYCDCEKLDQAGRIHQWIAKGYKESDQIDEAIDMYKITIKYFNARGLKNQVLTCERKIASLLCSLERFEEAAETYQAIGVKELQNNLTKYCAHISFFNSIILSLHGLVKEGRKPYDFSKVKERIKWAKEVDFRFQVSPSCDFLQNIILILSREGNTLHIFIDHLYDFDSLYPLDSLWLNVIEDIMEFHFMDQINQCKEICKMNLN